MGLMDHRLLLIMSKLIQAIPTFQQHRHRTTLSICLSVCLSIYLSIYLSICLSVCLSVGLCGCLSNIKCSSDQFFVDIGVVLATWWRHYLFLIAVIFLSTGSLDCLMELVLRFLHCRAWNNFAAGPRQVDRLNLFWLGHNPFLAGQKFITSYLYKIKFSTRSVNDRTKCLVIQGFDPTKHTIERTFQALLIEKTKCTSYLKIACGLLTSLVVAMTFGRHL